jgi:hypothetical protein
MQSETPKRWLVVVGLCLVLAASVAAEINVFRVAGTQEDEGFPTVSGNIVVWQYFNSRYGDWEIEGADITDPAAPQAFAITDIPGDDIFPVIDGNDVVWQHQRNANSDGDVYGANVANRPSVPIHAISASGDDERLPCVSKGVAVWQHKLAGVPDWDVAGAKLTGKDNPDSFYVSAAIDVDELAPCISGRLVVWHQKAPDLPRPMVYGADISDPNRPHTFYTAMALGDYELPWLSDGWLVARETDGLGQVMVDNLFDPFNPEGISGSGRTACPKIHQHLVVWQDQSNNTWDIRGYNLRTRQEFVVTNMKMSDQVNPAVYFDSVRQRAVIVWQDDRNGDWDIYAALVTGPEVATEPAQ